MSDGHTLEHCPCVTSVLGRPIQYSLGSSFQIALQDLQTNSKIAALLPYFVYVVSGVSEQGLGEELAGRLLPTPQ